MNLAGSPTAGNPHSEKWARELRESRVTTTQVLARAIADSERKPAYLAGNGISYYGDRGDEVLTEESDSRGDALLTSVTRDWQAAADPAVEAGARVCILRTSPVMDRAQRAAQAAAAAVQGSASAASSAAATTTCRCCRCGTGSGASSTWPSTTRVGPGQPDLPEAADQRRVHRGAGPPALATVVRPRSEGPDQVGAGRMADEILGSMNARPAVLEASGYAFQDRDVAEVLRAGLTRTDATSHWPSTRRSTIVRADGSSTGSGSPSDSPPRPGRRPRGPTGRRSG